MRKKREKIQKKKKKKYKKIKIKMNEKKIQRKKGMTLKIPKLTQVIIIINI